MMSWTHDFRYGTVHLRWRIWAIGVMVSPTVERSYIVTFQLGSFGLSTKITLDDPAVTT